MGQRTCKLISISAIILAGQAAAHAATLQLELNASDYNATTGTLTPSTTATAGLTAAVGSSNTVYNAPIIVPNATPSGASAIGFDGTSGFGFNKVETRDQNTTFFAVVEPNAALTLGSVAAAICGGAAQSTIEYRIDSNLTQEALVNQRFTQGSSNTPLSTTGWSVIELVFNEDAPAASTFYLNGVNDTNTAIANTAGNAGGGISRFGATQVGGSGYADYFNGEIADFQQYDASTFAAGDNTAIYNSLVAQYLTPVPEPTSLGLVGIGTIGLLRRRRLH